MASPHLPSRPKADVLSIEDLVESVNAGRIRIPDFQRPLRWRARNVEALLDSIWRGYPVGNLLFWKRKGPAETIQIGNLVLSVTERSDALYVVDGQQRLTALANVLLHAHPTKSSRDIFALWFDLEEECFVGPTRQSPDRVLLPLNRVLDAVELQTWWSEQVHLRERHDLFRTALTLGKRIREYAIPAYVVETSDIDVLPVIFTRLNTAGLGMKAHEVFRALNLVDGDDDPLRSVGRVFTEEGMGTWNRDALLQCLRAAAGDDLSTPMDQEFAAYRPKVEGSCTAISLALEFLRDEAHIPHIKLLPGRFPLLALVRFFAHHTEVSARVKVLLRRWFWRGVVTRRHIDMNHPRLHWLHVNITDNMDRTLECMLKDAGRPTSEDFRAFAKSIIEEDIKANSVVSKVGVTILATSEPRDVRTGDLIDVAELIEVAGTAAFGRPDRRGNWRVIHPRIEHLARSLDEAGEDVRESHLWVPHDRGTRRRERLSASFVERLAAWCEHGASDHLPIRPMFAALGEE